MSFTNYPVEWILGLILLLSSLGVVLAVKPVHASLSFLLTLLTLAVFYVQLSAPFIAVMQVLVYAGAILVIFMFVVVLFQDAHAQILKLPEHSMRLLTYSSAGIFVVALIALGSKLGGVSNKPEVLPAGYGTVESLGHALYVDYFFPFEAIILLFLIAVVGAVYIGKKVK